MADDKPPRGSKQAPPKAPETGGRPSVERALALRDVMAHAVEVEKEVHKSDAPPGRSPAARVTMLAFSIIGLAFSVYSYVARPEFIWGPQEKSIPEVRRDANLRFTLYLLGQRIRAYRRTNGTLPASLADVGESPRGITYAIVSDTVFELRAMDGAREVVFRSDVRPDEFLGDTKRHIVGREP